MLLEIILFLLLGILAGTLTGLIPGIHINLIGGILVSLSASVFYMISPISMVVFIVSMAITHTFVDFIPSVFLGCPDEDTMLSVLPGHELLKKGEGYEAILLTCYGGLASIFMLVLISVPSIILIEKVYDTFRIFIPFLLILVSAFLIFSENNKFSALLVFSLTGLLGWSALNFNPNDSDKFLLPLLTGLFGSSTIIVSIKNKAKIPQQKITKPKMNLIKPLIGSLIASPICSFLPGLGSGQAAVIGNFISKSDTKGFMVLLGATNTLVMGFSFITLYAISKTRTGAASAIQEIVGGISANVLAFILLVVILSGIIAFFIAKYLAQFFSLKIDSINYSFLSISTIILLLIVVFIISGIAGLVILAASTLAGIYSISLKVRRTNMMGCLIIPTIIFYLF